MIFSFKYVISAIKRRRFRTVVIVMALMVSVGLVSAFLGLVDTQQQFSLQIAGAQTGGYDMSIRKSDLSPSAFFSPSEIAKLQEITQSPIASTYARIQGRAEARTTQQAGTHEGRGTKLLIIGLETNKDNLIRAMPAQGDYSLGSGQTFLSQEAANSLGAKVGDELHLSYILPTQRDVGEAASADTSTVRKDATFLVAGVGDITGLDEQTQEVTLLRLNDAQQWLAVPQQVERLLIVWRGDTLLGRNVTGILANARDIGERVRNSLQQRLGGNYIVSLPKYTQLNKGSQAFVFQQSFITLYGILSIGIVGIMINALMTTTASEQQRDLAILRILGASRTRLLQPIIVEVSVIGSVGTILGLLIGRVINDAILAPQVLSNIRSSAAINTMWRLESVFIPVLITAIVLILATLGPAAKVARVKVITVLNPAAADHPTIADLSKLRERRPNYSLLVAGVVLLLFCSVILIVFPIISSTGNITLLVVLVVGAYLLMVIGTALIFYFVANPIERIVLAIFQLFSWRAAFFTSRYALRSKGRNSLISLMVVVSAVLPCLLATRLVIGDANLDTDTKFQQGTPIVIKVNGDSEITPQSSPSSSQQEQVPGLSYADLASVTHMDGIATAVGVVEGVTTEASDLVRMRTTPARLVGVSGDLSRVLFLEFFKWVEGDNSALDSIARNSNLVIISQGLAEAQDLHVGNQLQLTGKGLDHVQIVTVQAVAARIPGVGGISRNRAEAESGNSTILVGLESYIDLSHGLTQISPTYDDLTFNRILAKPILGFDESLLSQLLKNDLSGKKVVSIEMTSKLIAESRERLIQQRVFIVLLAILSMVTATLGVLAVIFTTVTGRTIEIGMLKAIGSSAGDLRRIFVGEAVTGAMAAALAGIIAGTLLGYAFEITQRLQDNTPLLMAFDGTTSLLILVLVVLASIISASFATQPVIRHKVVSIFNAK